MIHSITLTTWRTAATVPHCLAFASTILRLSHRYRLRRLWLDDYAAFVCLLVNIIYFVSLWLRTSVGDHSQPVETRIVIYWLAGISFPCVVWSARISLALSILRILPPRDTLRRVAIGMVIAFGLMWMMLIIEIIWVCGHSASWHFGPFQCHLGRLVGITGLCLDIIADALLVVTPLRMLWRVKLPKNYRRLILSIFSASVLTSLASIVYAVFVFSPKSWGTAAGALILLSAHLEAATSLLVCNLLVVVTFFYRIFRNGEDIEIYQNEDSFYQDPTAVTTRAVPLTTISFMGASRPDTYDTNATAVPFQSRPGMVDKKVDGSFVK